MNQEWIVDVLTDLQVFAHQNEFGRLAEHLNEAKLIAALEVASRAKGADIGASGGNYRMGQCTGTT
jgi:hypothetical protein